MSKLLTINGLDKVMGYNVAGYRLSNVKEYEDRYEIIGSSSIPMFELRIIIYRNVDVRYTPPLNDCREYRVILEKWETGPVLRNRLDVREFKSSFLRMSDMIGWLSDVQTQMYNP